MRFKIEAVDRWSGREEPRIRIYKGRSGEFLAEIPFRWGSGLSRYAEFCACRDFLWDWAEQNLEPDSFGRIQIWVQEEGPWLVWFRHTMSKPGFWSRESTAYAEPSDASS